MSYYKKTHGPFKEDMMNEEEWENDFWTSQILDEEGDVFLDMEEHRLGMRELLGDHSR